MQSPLYSAPVVHHYNTITQSRYLSVAYFIFIFDSTAFYNYRALQIKIARHTTANLKTSLYPTLLSDALKRMYSQFHNQQILRFSITHMYGTIGPQCRLFQVLGTLTVSSGIMSHALSLPPTETHSDHVHATIIGWKNFDIRG